MNSYDSLYQRLTELTHQLNYKDKELNEHLHEVIKADIDNIEQDLEEVKKDLQDDLRHRIEAVKKGIKDRKDDLRHRIEEIKKQTKDRARKEAENALNVMEEDLSNGDIVLAHIDRWVANQWLKASK